MPTLTVAIDASGAKAGADSFNASAASIQQSSSKTISAVKAVIEVFVTFESIKKVIETLSDFDDVMHKVSNRAMLTGEQFVAVGDKLVAMSTRLPMTAVALGEIAAQAGLLGVRGVSNIESFTKVMAEMGAVTDLNVGSGTQALGHLLNVAGENINTIKELAGTVLALSHAFNVSASDLVDTATFIAMNTRLYHVSSEQAAAVGAVFTRMGIQVRLAGTEVLQTFEKMDDAIHQGGPLLKDFANISGMTAEQFKKVFSRNAVEALQAFVAGLHKSVEAGADAGNVLEHFGLKGSMALKVIGGLSTNQDQLAKAINIANDSMNNQSKLDQEAAAMWESMGSKLQILWNTIQAATLGNREWGESIKTALDVVTQSVRILFGMENQVDGNTRAAKALALAFEVVGAVLAVIIAIQIVLFFTNMVTQLWAAVTAATALSGALWPVLVAFTALATAVMAFEFGSWLGSEFKIVRDYSDAFVTGCLTIWNALRYGIKVVIISIEGAWDIAMDAMRGKAKALVDAVNIALHASGASILVPDLGGGGSPAMAAGNDKLAAAKKEYEGLQDFIGTLALQGQQDLDAEFQGKDRKGTSFFDFLAADIDKLKNAVLGAAMPDIASHIKQIHDEVQNGVKPIGDYGAAVDYMTKEAEAATKALEKMRVQFAERQSDAGLSVPQRELADAVLKINEQITKGASPWQGWLVQLQVQSTLASEGAAKLTEMNAALDVQRSEIEMTTAARQVDEEVRKAQKIVDDYNITNGDKQVQQIKQKIIANQALEASYTKLKTISDGVGASFGSAFTDFISGAKNAQQAVKDLAAEIEKMVLQQAVAAPIASMISGGMMSMFGAIGLAGMLGGAAKVGTPAPGAVGSTFNGPPIASALGNLFYGGRVQPFADGGVIGGPTMFPLGIAGESGPEAIMPLSRGADGKLGVRGSGTNVTINVTTPDADSFRRSSGQVASAVKRRLA